MLIIATSVSGYFIRPLAAKDRIETTATETDREVNETILHASLADVPSNLPALEQFDVNGDGRGAEVQVDYLSVAQGGRAEERAAPPKLRPISDGTFANSQSFNFAIPAEDKPADPSESR